ncbi:MAG TPA: 50S ribosomal protein L25/general stress protein Ctc [Mycobacteriales bacterium]|nr:50S ribosomal protein L25/general stress protein Ctc [Mycobacteriales bacterium]
MSEVRIAAEPRTEFGKGAARRIRRARKVPAVIYGHGTKPQHVSLPGHELMLALKTPNVLLRVDLGNAEALLALPKGIQRDPLKGFLEHVDLLLVRRGEQVDVEIPIVFRGESPRDVVVEHQLTTLPVHAEATQIPQSVEVSVDALRPGSSITAGELPLPPTVTLATDPDTVVAHATAAPTAEQLETEIAEAAAELGAATTGAAAQGTAATTGAGDVVPETSSPGGGPERSPAETADASGSATA